MRSIGKCTAIKRCLFVLACSVAVLYIAQTTLLIHATTSVVTLYPDGDSFATGGGRWSGVGGSSCSQIYCRINEEVNSTSEYALHSNSANGADAQYFTLTDPEYVGQGVTNFHLRFWGASESRNVLADSTYDDMMSRAMYNMTAVNVGIDIFQSPNEIRYDPFQVSGYPGNYHYLEFNQSQSGMWTKQQIDDAQIGFSRAQRGSILQHETQRISSAHVNITYTQPPAWNQTNYRIYQSSASTTPGAAFAAENQPARLPSEGDAFRLRMGLVAGETAWSASFGNYKLQYATKAGSCSSSSFVDIQSGSGAIRWHNAGPTDGASITSYASDPSGAKTYQAYRMSNPFTNASAVPMGNLALWDFSLKDYSNQPGTTYCFRIVKQDQVGGYESITYTRYPEIQTVGVLSINFVNDAQALIAPTVTFDSKNMLFECQTSTSQTVFGGSYIRVNNDISESGWTASIAATDGPAATWYDPVSGNRMDFNDGAGSPAGCYAGSDGDTYPGQLTVNSGALTIARQKAGCSASGLSAGSTASFQETVLDAVTLYSASSSSDIFCWWDIGNLTFDQRIPPLTPAGEYELDMTVTVTAS